MYNKKTNYTNYFQLYSGFFKAKEIFLFKRLKKWSLSKLKEEQNPCNFHKKKQIWIPFFSSCHFHKDNFFMTTIFKLI